MLARLGLDVDLDVPVGTVSIAERQLIELARVLLQHPSVLILDEPNSALNDRETQRLFAILRELAGEGITVLYVSHRLEEVFQIADRVTVMRDGREILTRDTTALTIPEVVEAMVGTKQEDLFPERTGSVDAGGASLVVDGLSVGTGLTDVSFEARPGEIVGLAGIAGSGIELLLGTLFGERRASTGTVRYPDGGPLPTSPTRAARRRVSLVPADRRTQGLMLDRSVASNVVQVAVGAMPSTNPWLSRRATDAVADRQIGRLGIKTAGPSAPVSALSGGNQQKVVLAKWLEVSPTVVLLDDPTRGVDVGAKHEIYALVRQLADSGRIVLLRSTELPEIIGLADRILVFYRGRLATECRGCRRHDPRPAARRQHWRLVNEPEVHEPRRCRNHDPSSVHDAPAARGLGRVQAPPRRDLGRNWSPRSNARASPRSRSSRTTRCCSSTRRSPTRRRGTASGTARSTIGGVR